MRSLPFLGPGLVYNIPMGDPRESQLNYQVIPAEFIMPMLLATFCSGKWINIFRFSGFDIVAEIGTLVDIASANSVLDGLSPI